MNIDRLGAKVKAYNTAAERAKAVCTELATALTPFLGQKVLKADGTLLAKVEKILPKFERTNNLQIFNTNSKYYLVWTVKATFSCGDHCEYESISVYVGELSDDNTLTRIYDAPDIRSDYTEEEVLTSLREVKVAQENLEAAKRKLPPIEL